MLSLETDQDHVARALESKPQVCKVLLKTADDPILLPIWLDHYLKMFDPEQIVIADNGSADPLVLEMYGNLPAGVVVFSYASDRVAFHDNIHDRAQFAGLYAAIRHSCRYLLSVDTDELLYIAGAETWSLDRTLLHRLLQAGGGRAVPTTWVHNLHGSLDTFYVPDVERLAWDLRWGKPFVPTVFALGGPRIHNVQFPQPFFAPETGAGFFLLHLVNYSREQRLKVNKRKLIARGVAAADDSYEEIAARPRPPSDDPTPLRLVDEISKLLVQPWPAEPGRVLGRGCVRFAAGGHVEYADEDTKRILSTFRAGFRSYFEQAFR